MLKVGFAVIVVSFVISAIANSAEEGMPKMPRITPKRIYTVPSKEAGEELLEQRGYGDKEPMIRMMNLMMVGGSGYEGMDMSEMGAHEMKAQGSHHTHGEHQVESGHEAHAQPTIPPVPKPAEGQTASYDFEIKITPSPPKVGTNSISVSIQKKNAVEPARGLKIKAQVYMTSMDMGTEEPKVTEIEPGRYKLEAVFSMKGPWAVKILLPEGGEKVFTFEVGS